MQSYPGLFHSFPCRRCRLQAEKKSLENYLISHFNVNEVKVTLKETDDEVHFVREMNSFEKKLQKMMFDVHSKVVLLSDVPDLCVGISVF